MVLLSLRPGHCPSSEHSSKGRIPAQGHVSNFVCFCGFRNLLSHYSGVAMHTKRKHSHPQPNRFQHHLRCPPRKYGTTGCMVLNENFGVVGLAFDAVAFHSLWHSSSCLFLASHVQERVGRTIKPANARPHIRSVRTCTIRSLQLGP